MCGGCVTITEKSYGTTVPAFTSSSVASWSLSSEIRLHQKKNVMSRSKKTTTMPITFLVTTTSLEPKVTLEELHWTTIAYCQFAKVACGSVHKSWGRSSAANLNVHFFLFLHY